MLSEEKKKRGVTLTTLRFGGGLCVHKCEASLKEAVFPQKSFKNKEFNKTVYPSRHAINCMCIYEIMSCKNEESKECQVFIEQLKIFHSQL